MKKAGIRAVSRQERPEPAGLASENVKFFLDKREGRLYPPRFISEGPTPWGVKRFRPQPRLSHRGQGLKSDENDAYRNEKVGNTVFLYLR